MRKLEYKAAGVSERVRSLYELLFSWKHKAELNVSDAVSANAI